jgi:gliding motility-associated-like protein
LRFSKTISLIIVLTFCLSAKGQNILSNSNYDTLRNTFFCADWIGGFTNTRVFNWYSPLDTLGNYLTAVGWLSHACQDPWQMWQNTSNAKPGYYPFPKPKAGIAYGQLTLRNGNLNRGFISQKLKDTLAVGTEYCAEFYTRPFMWSKWVTNNIGIYFSADSLDYYAYTQNLTPHVEAAQVISDTTVWTRVNGSFIATGNEHFINFGNFRSDVGSNFIPSGFPIDPWFTYNIPSYLIDAPLLCKCSDTLYTAKFPYADTLLCPNEQLVLQPLLDGFKLEDTTTTYLWSTGSTDSTITVTQPGTYWVHTTINQRFVAGDTIVVDFFPANYQFNLPDTVTFCEGDQAVIQSAVLPPNYAALTAYLWNTGSTLTGIAVRNPGLYWLNAQTPCYTLTDSTWVLQDFCESYLWVPNAFTPDGDGLNDFFEFQGAPAPVTLHIFDRWGKRVFYSDNYNPETSGWDGTYQGEPLPGGVYTYLIEYNYINPNATQPDAKGSPQQARGTVTIIR